MIYHEHIFHDTNMIDIKENCENIIIASYSKKCHPRSQYNIHFRNINIYII